MIMGILDYSVVTAALAVLAAAAAVAAVEEAAL